MTVKVICIGSTGADLPRAILEKSGNTLLSRFNVTVGAEYVVRAMALWTYGLGVLIVDDTGRPNWKPIGLFDVIDKQLPTGWEFTIVSQREPVLAFWGYPALIHDPNHHDDLIDRRLSAFETFLRESTADQDPRLRKPSQEAF